MKVLAARIVLAWLGLTASIGVQAQVAPVTLGVTSTLSGPSAAYGQGLLHGMRVAVARANAAGGVVGRPLELVVLDDGGDSQRAARNAHQLLGQGVVALTGVLGAGATMAVAAALVEQGAGAVQAALIAPATGAESLRDPPLPGVFHVRAGAAEEAAAAVLHLDTLGISNYALVTQDDAYGESGRERLVFELTRIAVRPGATVRIPAGAAAPVIRRVLDEICATKPQALILAVDAAAASIAVQEGKVRHCASHYLVFSETGAALTPRNPGSTGPHPLAGLLVTQVVPHPNHRLNPLVGEYQQALTAHGNSVGSYASLEGYLAMRVIVEALLRCSKPPQRACVLHALKTGTFDLPGMRIQLGARQRQTRPFVDITLLDADGQLRR